MKNLILAGLVAGTLSVIAITNTIPNNLLDKRYNEVTFLMTHNATSLRHESTTLGDKLRAIASFLPNSYPFTGLRDKVYDIIRTITLQDPNIVADQERDLNAQLRDGVRGFKLPIQMADTDHPAQSDIIVCHSLTESQFATLIKEAEDKLSFIPIKKIREALLKPLYELQDNPCKIDTTHVRLFDAFSTLNQWLDQNPREVIGIYLDVSFINKDAAKATLQAILQKSGLANKLYRYTNGQWPTIRTMTNTNKRVVLFASCANWKDLGIAYTNNITFGSNYSYKDPSVIYADTANPTVSHGTAGPNQIFILDNYTTPLISGRVVHAQQVNRYDRVMARVVQYEKLASQPVTFVMVDFYNEPNSDAIKAVQDINKARG